MPYVNVVKRRKYQRKYMHGWYDRNKAKHIKLVATSRRKLKRVNKQKVVNYLLSHPCVDCPEKDPVVLEFDHIRGKKIENISVMVQQGKAWKTIEAEILKCEVRCANCHRRITHKRRVGSSIGRALGS